jgi:hypothetical protein
MDAICSAQAEATDARRTQGQPGDPRKQLKSSSSDPPESQQKKPHKKSKMSAVLGKDTLASFAEDRQNMILPPWVSAPPHRAGHTSHRKLSADQGQVLSTMNLPITLICLWGNQPGTRQYKMLDNFLDWIAGMTATVHRQSPTLGCHGGHCPASVCTP